MSDADDGTRRSTGPGPGWMGRGPDSSPGSGPGSGSKAVRGVSDRRGRAAVAASILGALILGAYLAASPGELGSLPGSFLVSAIVLVVAFWFPAMRIGSVRDVRTGWLPLGVWLLAWTLVWDLATSGVVGERVLFQEWWIVYPAGVVVLGALLVLHGAVVGRNAGAAGRTEGR
jgi:succinate dehydrogenase/fumarate reductase cytochrome b subunit